jgi:hypothetical protein
VSPFNLPGLFKFLAASGLVVFGVGGHAALAQPIPAKSLTPDEARFDVRVLKRTLTALHPGLTKYQTETEWQAALARFEARGNAARTVTEMFLAASELAASIRCGHTWTNILNQQGAIKASLLESADKLPFTMTLVEGRWLVLASANARIGKGDEVMAINGVAAPDMVKMVWPYLRADGASDSKRLRQLGHDRFHYSQMDIIWPLLSPPVMGRYQVTTRRGGEATQTFATEPLSMAGRAAALAKQAAKHGAMPTDERWTLRIDGDTATLRLPTFSFWNSKFDWAGFLASSFAELNARKVPNLIIDIRDNEGGDGAIGGKIVAYLLKQPFRYISNQSVTTYERVPYNLVRYLDTWDYGFFDRTGKVEKITDGPQAGKYAFTPRVFGERVVTPVAEPYQGKAFMLVGGENSSATFQFAWLAQKTGVATLVGQATGGNLRGLSGSELTWVTLPNSGVAVDIPLLATRYQSDTPDASVTPEIRVTRTFDNQRAGKDEELDAARALIGKG